MQLNDLVDLTSKLNEINESLNNLKRLSMTLHTYIQNSDNLVPCDVENLAFVLNQKNLDFKEFDSQLNELIERLNQIEILTQVLLNPQGRDNFTSEERKSLISILTRISNEIKEKINSLAVEWAI